MVGDQHVEILETFTEKHGFLSEAEVIRQALVFFYRKFEPAYLKPTVTQKIKEKAISEKEKLEKMPDVEYCETIVKGIIVKNPQGKEFVLYHGWARDLRCLPVDVAKEFFAKHADFLDNHLVQLKDRPVTAAFNTYYMNEIKERYGIVMTQNEDGTWSNVVDESNETKE